VHSLRNAAQLRTVPACGGWLTPDVSSAAVMSGPSTEDVRGGTWRPLPGQAAEAASNQRPERERDDHEQDSGNGELPEVPASPEEEGDAAESQP
jgi:hypothetical protein